MNSLKANIPIKDTHNVPQRNWTYEIIPDQTKIVQFCFALIFSFREAGVI